MVKQGRGSGKGKWKGGWKGEGKGKGEWKEAGWWGEGQSVKLTADRVHFGSGSSAYERSSVVIAVVLATIYPGFVSECRSKRSVRV